MKKIILIIAIIASAFSASAQDSLYINKKDGSILPYAIADVDSITFARKATAQATDTVEVINGVKWATRNVAAPGTFATAAENAGMFYQWNSNVGWPATGDIGSITATNGSKIWNGSWTGGYTNPSSSDTWTSTNDPSPKGWRVPTSTEIQALLNTNYVTYTWTTQNGVYGEKFTDKNTGNSIFLPASGCRNYSDGTLKDAGSIGYFWLNTASNGNYAYELGFNNSLANWNLAPNRAHGLLLRSVLK